MDFHCMTRKALQSLCKKHNIPANGTNLKMADALLNQAHEEIKTRDPSWLEGSGGESVLQLAESDRVDLMAVVKAPKKVRFLLSEDVPDGGMRRGSRYSSQIGPEAEEDGVNGRKDASDETVEEEREELVRTTRSRSRKSSVGDVARLPIVGKRKTRNGRESELVEETENLNELKAVEKIGVFSNRVCQIKKDWKNSVLPHQGNELTEIDAQPEKVTRRSNHNTARKLTVFAPADAEMQKEVDTSPAVVAEEPGLESRDKECGMAVEEEQETFVRATRSQTRKSIVVDATQFPILEKRKTRNGSKSVVNKEKDVNGDIKEEKKMRGAKGKMDVRESPNRVAENYGDQEKSELQVAELDPVKLKAVVKAPKKVWFLLQEEVPDGGMPHGKRRGGRYSSQLWPEAEEDGVTGRKSVSDETVVEEREALVRTTRSRSRKSLVGDVAQLPIVGKRKTIGCVSELVEDTKNSNQLKAMEKVGECLNRVCDIRQDRKSSEQPHQANELTDIVAQLEKVTRWSKRNAVRKLTVSAPADTEMQKEVDTIPAVQAEEPGVQRRNKECGMTVEEEQEIFVRATRSRTRKSIVVDATQFPILEKRKTRNGSKSEFNKEKDVNGDIKEEKKTRGAKGKMDVGERPNRDAENYGDQEKSELLGEEDELTEIHAEPNKRTRRSKRNALVLAASAPADAEMQKDGVGIEPLNINVESEETCVKSGKKESNKTVEKEHEMLVRTTRSRARKLLKGDVTQFPIEKKTSTRSVLEINEDNGEIEEKKKRGTLKSKRGSSNVVVENDEVGKKYGLLCEANELIEIHSQPDEGTRRSKRNISKLAVSAPAGSEMLKDEVARIPLKNMVEAEETGVNSRKKESDERLKEKPEMLVRTTRSCTKKLLVGDVTQFPIVENQRTRERSELQTIDKEKNANGNLELKRNMSKVKIVLEVGKNSKDGEIGGCLKVSRQSDKANESSHMHSQPDKAARRSKRNAPKFAVSVAGDKDMEMDEVVKEDEPRKRSRNEIIAEVDSDTECGTGFDNKAEVSEETFAENRTRVDNELEVVDGPQGCSKHLESLKCEVCISSNGKIEHQKRQMGLVADGAAVEGTIPNNHHVNDNQGNTVPNVLEAAEECEMKKCPSSGQQIYLRDDGLASCAHISPGCAVDHGAFDHKDELEFTEGSDDGLINTVRDECEVVLNDNGIAEEHSEKSDCAQGENNFSNVMHKVVSEGLLEIATPEVSSTELEEFDIGYKNTQTVSKQCDIEVVKENGDDVKDTTGEFREVSETVMADTDQGCETGKRLNDNSEEFEERIAKAVEENVQDMNKQRNSEMLSKYDNGDESESLLGMVEECKTDKEPSLGRKIYLGDDSGASSTQVTPESVVERDCAFDHKDQVVFEQTVDRFPEMVALVRGNYEIISNENGITQDIEEDNGHKDVEEDNDHKHAHKEGAVSDEICRVEYGSGQIISEQCDAKSGEKKGDDADNISKGEFQEAPETVIEYADWICKMGPKLKVNSGEVEGRNVKTAEENAGDACKLENAEVFVKYDGDEKFGNFVAGSKLLETLEECKTVKNPLLDRKIIFGNDGLASCTHTAPADVKYHCSVDHRDQLEFTEVVDGFIEAVTVELVHGDGEVIFNEKGSTKGNGEKSDHEDAQEENTSANETCRGEYGIIQTILDQCDSKGSENGDDARNFHSFVPGEFQETPEDSMEDADRGGCKTGMVMKDNWKKIEERTVKTLEDDTEDAEEKENVEMLYKYGDDESFENFVSSSNLSNIMMEECETVDKPSLGHKVFAGDDGLASFTKITPQRAVDYDLLKKEKKIAEPGDEFAETVTREFAVDCKVVPMENRVSEGNSEESGNKDVEKENGLLNEICTPVSELRETSKPEPGSVKPEEFSVMCSNILSVSKHSDADGIEENGDNAKETCRVVLIDFQEVPKTAREVADLDYTVDAEVEDCENVEKRHAKTVEVDSGVDVGEKENAEILVHKYRDHEGSENCVAVTHQKSEGLEFGGTVEMVSCGVCTFSPVGPPKLQDSLAGNEKEPSRKKILLLENHDYGVDDREVQVSTTTSKPSSEVMNFFSDNDVKEDAVECVNKALINAKEVEDESPLNCVGARANSEKGQEVSEANVNKSFLQEEFNEASDAVQNGLEHQAEVEKLQCEDHAEIVEVKGQGEGFLSYEAGKTMENLHKDECMKATNKTLKDKNYEDSMEDIMYTGDHELHHKDNCEETEKRENAGNKTENSHCNKEAICVQCEEPLEVLEADKMTVDSFALGSTCLAPVNAPECQGINQEEVDCTSMPEEFVCQNYVKEGSANSLGGIVIAAEPVEGESPITCEAAEMQGEDTQEVSGPEETESSFWKEFGEASNLEGTLGELEHRREGLPHFDPERLDCKDCAESDKMMKGSGESVLEALHSISFEEVMVEEETEKKEGSSCDYTKVIHENECLLDAMEKELKWTADNLFHEELAFEEGESPITCEAAEMQGGDTQEVSGPEETESIFWKQFREASSLKGTLGELEHRREVLPHFDPERLDCRDCAESDKMMKGSGESVLEVLHSISFEEVMVDEETEKKEGSSCDYTQVIHENECLLDAMEKELKWTTDNLFHEELAYAVRDESNYDYCKENCKRDNTDSQMQNFVCKESEEAALVKPDDPLEVPEVEERHPDFGVDTVHLAPNDDGKYQESREIRVTELPDKLSNESTGCTSENFGSEGGVSLIDEAEAAPVPRGEEEHLADGSRLEITGSFKTKDDIGEKGSLVPGEESHIASKVIVEEGLVSADSKEGFENEAVAQVTEEKETAVTLEEKLDSDDSKYVSGDNGSVGPSPQKFDFAGSSGDSLQKVAIIPSLEEDCKHSTELPELQNFGEMSSPLQCELGRDNCSSPSTDMELQVSTNEHGKDLASIVDAATSIRSPATDPSKRSTGCFVCIEQEGREESGNAWSSFGRHVSSEDGSHEVLANLIGSGNLEGRVEEISGHLDDMGISTVDVEKQNPTIESEKLKSVESLKHWPLSARMKENAPAIKQAELSNHTVEKSATSIRERRALQDLRTVKEQ